MSEIVVKISEDKLTTLYTDEFPLRELGQISSRRASHVEPEQLNGEEVWVVKLAEAVETQHGRFPEGSIIATDKSRKKALKKEVAWLHKHALDYRGEEKA